MPSVARRVLMERREGRYFSRHTIVNQPVLNKKNQSMPPGIGQLLFESNAPAKILPVTRFLNDSIFES